MKLVNAGWPLSWLHSLRTWFCLSEEKVILTGSVFPLVNQLVFFFIIDFAVCEKSSLDTINLPTWSGHGHKYLTAIKFSWTPVCPRLPRVFPTLGIWRVVPVRVNWAFSQLLQDFPLVGFSPFPCPPWGIGSVRPVSAGSSKLAVAKPLSPGQLCLATFRPPFPGFPGQVHGMVFRGLHPTALFHGQLTSSRSAVPGDSCSLSWQVRHGDWSQSVTVVGTCCNSSSHGIDLGAGSSSRNWGGDLTLKAYPSGRHHLARSCVPKFM